MRTLLLKRLADEICPVSATSPGGDEKSGDDKQKKHALYGHGMCKWPGCDTPCEDLNAFLK